MAEQFFKEETTPETSETIKVGDKDFTQEELGKLVGLGQMAEEAETRYGKSIEKYWPEFTKRSQELKAAQEEINELKAFKDRISTPEVKLPTQEELQSQAREQARNLGLTDEETTRRIYREERAAEKLLDEIDGLNKDAQTAGKPVADKEVLIKYMVDEGFRSPTKAYKDMYENELKEWETKKINEIKQPGYTTQGTSTAGSKEPVFETPKTADELQKALNSFFNSGEGAENA